MFRINHHKTSNVPPKERTSQELDKKQPIIYELPDPKYGRMVVNDSNDKCVYPLPTECPIIINTKADGKPDGVDTVRVELKQFREPPGTAIRGPDDVFTLVQEMIDYDRERIKIIYLDTKNRVIGIENISTGTISEALTKPREAVKGAVLASASSVIFIHNHPSGIPEPSSSDDRVVQLMVNAFHIMAIKVLDFMIIGSEGFYSYTNEGTMPTPHIDSSIDTIYETLQDVAGKYDGSDSGNAACHIATQAALEIMKERCGVGNKTVQINGVKIPVPPTGANPEFKVLEDDALDKYHKIEAFKKSKWAHDEAQKLCVKLFNYTPGSPEYNKCTEQMIDRLTEEVVGTITL